MQKRSAPWVRNPQPDPLPLAVLAADAGTDKSPGGFFTTGQRPSGSIRRMPAHPETITAKLKSAIIATVGWLALAVPFYGGLYACSEWLAPEPFATAAECRRALAELQYHEGHHGELLRRARKGRVVRVCV
jgi:hypothetical protein